MRGRRLTARSRYRSGNLMQSDGTLADAVSPMDPGTDPEAVETVPPWIDIDVSLGLFG